MAKNTWSLHRGMHQQLLLLCQENFLIGTVDEGPLFGFHRMNAFTGLEQLESIHFHDVEKNADIPKDLQRYREHLMSVFGESLKLKD